MTMLHNGTFHLAKGRHRWETSWKNLETSWPLLVEKLRKTHRTAETYKEYMAAPKERQDEIKDIGGFVGGYLTNGRRKSGNVLHRQLVTLDVDFADNYFWDTFSLLYGCAAVMYSTHKHSDATPRFRLIIPLDREVWADEYVAISRRIAGTLGIESFDDTTFQPERLMYWPSTAKDGTYVFELLDAPALKADDVLSTYHNWKDSSEWPVSARHSDRVKRDAKKQGEPTEKPGIVGAFCRTYTISEAIAKYLPDIYEPCDVEDRFTFKEGSTAGGLVVYEDKYAFSHHGTDPVSGKLCNAFDLVRLHLFGLKDEDAKAGTPVNKLPSHLEMQEYCTKDSRVRMQIVAERLDNAKAAFADVAPQDAAGIVGGEGFENEEVTDEELLGYQDGDESWQEKLDVDKKGNIQSTIDNIVLILENDPKLKGCIFWDDFEQRAVARRRLPWRGIGGATGRYLRDTDDDNLAHYLEKVYNIGSVKIDKALGVIYERYRYHPIREYLNSLVWDGVARIPTLLQTYLGVEDSNYTRAITRKMLAGAVARVFTPGCKFDYTVVLISEQGVKKSTFITQLGKQWFSDSITTVQGTKAYEQLQGSWIIELAELDGLKKAEVETIKNFIGKRTDKFRVAYGHRVESFPRQCIFIGTTNETRFLHDHTGGRRFWPAICRVLFRLKDPFYMSAEEVNQIWAEAVQLFRAGEPLFLDDELEAEAKEIQAEHTERDARADLVEEYLNKALPLEWPEMGHWERIEFLRGESDKIALLPRERVTIAEIWCECLGGQIKDLTQYNSKALHNLMRRSSGWIEGKSKTTSQGYGNLRYYQRVLEINPE